MKKCFFVIAVLFTIVFQGSASPVDPALARLVAKNMYFERAGMQGKIMYDEIVLEEAAIIQKGQNILYYVFNVSGNRGWVAVSGDNATVPVLSYALDGAYTGTDLPDNFAAWMSRYEKELAVVTESKLKQSAEAAGLWNYYGRADFTTGKNTTAVSPLLGSINWGQGCYYNTQCPSASGGDCNHVPTGCVATAMAMIMKKHAYPTSGFGSHSYTHATYGTLSANFGTATYGWASMPNTATGANTELAEIMKHCGVAVDMDYDVYGSGAFLADATTAFKNYFVYNAVYAIKANYTDADWKALLKADLDLGHPILYAGQDPGGGHAFVCDGYQGSSNDYFHFNWGWDGSYNSYNYLNDLTPGGYSSNGTFSTDQEAVVNIYPSPAVLPVANFSAGQTTFAINNYTGFTDLSTNTPLVWSWSVSPSTGTSFVGGTTSSSKNPKIAFTVSGQYTISLTATNAAGSDTETKSNYITVTGGAGIEDAEPLQVAVFPNPATDQLYVKFSGTETHPSEIRLFNRVGAVVYHELVGDPASTEVSITTSSLSEGLYYLNIRCGEKMYTQKVSVVR